MMAVKLREAGGDRVQELHARVLARQTPSSIAYAMGMPDNVVRCYLDLFFGIQDRLDAPAYILHEVIGLRSDGTPPATDQLMLAAAYRNGPFAMEAWLDFQPHAGEPHDLATLEGRTRESIELYILAHSLTADTETSCRVVKKAPFILETRQNYIRSRSVAEVFAARAYKALGDIPWALVESPQVLDAPTVVVDRDHTFEAETGMVA